MNKPWGPDLLYGLVLERWFGPHTAETRSFRQIGVDKYKKTHGISLLYTLINFYIPIFVLVVVLLLLLFISDKSEKYDIYSTAYSENYRQSGNNADQCSYSI
jgi:hypothetical protein